MRKLIVVLVVLTFSVLPLTAMTWDGGNQNCTVNVTLTIPGWAQVICQDNDGITFSGATSTAYNSDSNFDGTHGDWYDLGSWDGFYTQIDGGCDNKPSTDPFAGSAYINGGTDLNPTGVFYEATDYAHHYVKTNTGITGTVTTTNLTSTATNSSPIPHKFTIAFGAFVDGGSTVNVLNFPGSSDVGAYGSGTDGGTITLTGGSPQAFTNINYNLTPPAWGTITLHSRILRKGIIDVAGTYTSTINVSYQ